MYCLSCGSGGGLAAEAGARNHANEQDANENNVVFVELHLTLWSGAKG